MSKLEVIVEKIFKFFASIQLAVIVIVGLAVISAVGTIIEAKYDAQYAQKIVYHSVWMYFFLGLLCVNLINVMIDRWPWKKHHSAFIFAHVGIIVLIIGSGVTRYYGVDGTLSLEIGGSGRFLQLPDTEVAIYAHFGDGDYKLIDKHQVDFLLKPPSERQYSFSFENDSIKVYDYFHYAEAKETIVASSEPNDGAAIRFQIQSDRVNLTNWLVQDWRRDSERMDMGPATVSISQAVPKYSGRSEVVFQPMGEKLKYFVFTERKGGLSKSGIIQAGESTDLGWMDLRLRILKYVPKAKRVLEYVKQQYPTSNSTSVMRVEFKGQKYDIGLNNSIRIFSDTKAYIIGFFNRRYDLKFDVILKDFKVGRYQGTMRAMSYESLVEVPGGGTSLIYMNNPLKHNGYTLYQASFQENEMGVPVASILSVNRDPGRWIKYLGSLLIVIGIILLFYFKRAKIFTGS